VGIGLSIRFRCIDHGEHGLPQPLGMGELRIARACAERANHQPCGCLVTDAPMRDDERSRSGIEERPGEARKRFRTGFVFRRGIARR